MTEVLISIKPEWCELIKSGRKIMEVRRNRPKCDVPFRCYVYQSGNGGVIGEFTCYSILRHCEMANAYFAKSQGLLTDSMIADYSGNHTKELYGWGIMDMFVYKEPLPLTFFGLKRPPQSWCYVWRTDLMPLPESPKEVE